MMFNRAIPRMPPSVRAEPVEACPELAEGAPRLSRQGTRQVAAALESL